jgi:hypothetical protein
VEYRLLSIKKRKDRPSYILHRASLIKNKKQSDRIMIAAYFNIVGSPLVGNAFNVITNPLENINDELIEKIKKKVLNY